MVANKNESILWAVAPKPHDEDERVDEIIRLGLQEIDAESRFGDFPELARSLTGFNIALVSIVTEEKQCAHAVSGDFSTKENPREVSFCQFSILGDTVFEVPDTRDDPRFMKNPLVTGAPAHPGVCGGTTDYLTWLCLGLALCHPRRTA